MSRPMPLAAVAALAIAAAMATAALKPEPIVFSQSSPVAAQAASQER